jgi:DivIVA domain-containing protein
VVPVVILALVAVALVVAVLGVASGRLPAQPLADPVHSTPDPGLPEQPEATDVDAVRFDTAPRGYRMDEVDGRLAGLRDDLAERERTLATLRAETAETAETAEAAEAAEAAESTRGEPGAPGTAAAPEGG